MRIKKKMGDFARNKLYYVLNLVLIAPCSILVWRGLWEMGQGLWLVPSRCLRKDHTLNCRAISDLQSISILLIIWKGGRILATHSMNWNCNENASWLIFWYGGFTGRNLIRRRSGILGPPWLLVTINCLLLIKILSPDQYRMDPSLQTNVRTHIILLTQ